MLLEKKINEVLGTEGLNNARTRLNQKIADINATIPTAQTMGNINMHEEITRTRHWGIFYYTQAFTLFSYIAEKTQQLNDQWDPNKDMWDTVKKAQLNQAAYNYLLILTAVEEFNKLNESSELVLTQIDLNHFKRIVHDNLFLTEDKPGRKNAVDAWVASQVKNYKEALTEVCSEDGQKVRISSSSTI